MNKNFCILLDKNNNWLEPYVTQFLNKINLDIKKHLIYDLKNLNKFEICFVLGYMKILGEDVIKDSCKYYVIHESSLPKGKGFAPLTWQVLEGKKKIEACLIELSDPVDSGRIALKRTITLTGLELYEDLRAKQAATTFDLISCFLQDPLSINYKSQSGVSTFYKKRNTKDSKLDINKSIQDQFNLLRVCNNDEWPAYFEVDNQKYILKIYKSD
tara:strand:- start:5635 stop:6276 length:642 start_codon:yes stop_codon:yes gene_type:complete